MRWDPSGSGRLSYSDPWAQPPVIRKSLLPFPCYPRTEAKR
jgi:hypothetical protein